MWGSFTRRQQNLTLVGVRVELDREPGLKHLEIQAPGNSDKHLPVPGVEYIRASQGIHSTNDSEMYKRPLPNCTVYCTRYHNRGQLIVAHRFIQITDEGKIAYLVGFSVSLTEGSWGINNRPENACIYLRLNPHFSYMPIHSNLPAI